MRHLILQIVCAMVTTGALAAPISPYKALGLPDTLNSTRPLKPITAIEAGGFTMRLEKTMLEDVKKRFGGIKQASGDAGDAVEWLCYFDRKSSMLYWFISNVEMGQGRLTQIAIQGSSDGASSSGCGRAPASLTGIELDVPSIGSSLSAVVGYFKGGKPNRAGSLAYANERPVKGMDGFTTSQSVQYSIRAGRVRTVSVSQVTSN